MNDPMVGLPEVIYIPVSTELMRAMGEWSDPVQVRIVPRETAPETDLRPAFEMEVRRA